VSWPPARVPRAAAGPQTSAGSWPPPPGAVDVSALPRDHAGHRQNPPPSLAFSARPTAVPKAPTAMASNEFPPTTCNRPVSWAASSDSLQPTRTNQAARACARGAGLDPKTPSQSAGWPRDETYVPKAGHRWGASPRSRLIGPGGAQCPKPALAKEVPSERTTSPRVRPARVRIQPAKIPGPDFLESRHSEPLRGEALTARFPEEQSVERETKRPQSRARSSNQPAWRRAPGPPRSDAPRAPAIPPGLIGERPSSHRPAAQSPESSSIP
jgi:hypothetical protein